MSERRVDVLAKLVVAAGLVVVGASALAAWTLVLARLGASDGRAYLVIHALIALAAALVPISGTRWLARGGGSAQAKSGAISIELAIAVATALALVATANWWALRVGVAAPAPWVIGAACISVGGARLTHAMTTLSRKSTAPLILTAMSVARFATAPLAALIHGTLPFVFGASACANVALAAIALRVPIGESSDECALRSIINPSAWLAAIAGALPRMVVALAVAGAPLVPYETALLFSMALLTPFLLAAVIEVTTHTARLVRGVLLALATFTVIAILGPAIYRTFCPSWFAGEDLVPACAWHAIALVPLSFFRTRRDDPGWRNALTAIVVTAALIVLVQIRGVVGAIYASAIGWTFGAVLGIVDPHRAREEHTS